jgi:hypothetical protein
MVSWSARAVALVAALVFASSACDVLGQATPTTADLDVPAPEECQVEPRPLPLFPEGVGQLTAATPAPLPAAPEPPFTLPEGEAADAETVAAITATVREALACRNGNDFLRAYALFTQEMLVALFGGPATIDPEIAAAPAESPGPLPSRQRLALTAITGPVLLPDGRVAAVVDTRGARYAFRDLLIFEEDPTTGRWLIDDQVRLPAQAVPRRASDATPAP